GDLGTTHRMDRSARDGVDAGSIGKCWKCKDYREQTEDTSPCHCHLRGAKSYCGNLDSLHGPVQLRDEGDHGQDRLLRAWSLRKDDESAVHLRVAPVESQEQNALFVDQDRPHPLLRL